MLSTIAAWSTLSAKVCYAGGANIIWFNGDIAGRLDCSGIARLQPVEAFVLAYLKGFHQPSNIKAKVRALLK